MGLNKEELHKAANLPNDQFATLIYAVMMAAGASKAEATAAMMQAGTIKRRIASASDTELENLTNALPPQTVEAIKKTVMGEQNSGNG